MKRVVVAGALGVVALGALAVWSREHFAGSAPTPAPVALVVRLVDFETGAPVRGGAVALFGVPIPPTPAGDAFRLDASNLRRSDWCWLPLDVTAPPGYVRGRDWIRGFVGTFTEVAELTMPVRPEIDLVVEVRDEAGAPVAGATIHGCAVRVRGEYFGFAADPSDAAGRMVVRGVPFVRGANLRVGVERGERRGLAEVSLSERPAEPVVLRLTMSQTGTALDYYSSSGGVSAGPRDPREYVALHGDAAVDVTLPGVAAGVSLSLAGFDGTARSYWKLDGSTDMDGRIAFSGVPAGKCELQAFGRGIAGTDRWIIARAGETTTATVRPSDLSSVVTVLDQAGRPLPGASVQAFPADPWSGYGGPHVQDEGGVQQILPRTDTTERCTLRHLPAGVVTISVEWDDRQHPGEFTAGEDATVTLPADTSRVR